jgi:hypothetical protein
MRDDGSLTEERPAGEQHLGFGFDPRREPISDPAQWHRRLARFNRSRLSPAFPTAAWRSELERETELRLAEGEWVERERTRIAGFGAVPRSPDGFVHWFEELRETGPGQGDPLFPYLAEKATLPQMRWFIAQEMAGEAGFDDLAALAQIKLPTRAKLELARNYWDEMGRGHEEAMHGPMLERIGAALGVQSVLEETVWESLALANMMVALAINRRYAFQSLGALGVVEMTSPTRVGLVDIGLARLGIKPRARQYYKIHATLDVKHSIAWNREIFHSIVADNPAAAPAIAEGAMLRLTCGWRCYERYRREFGLSPGLTVQAPEYPIQSVAPHPVG